MRIALRVFTVLLLTALCSADEVVRAQAPVQPLESQQAAGWIFTPTIRVGGAWDDNVLLVGSPSHPPSDYTTPISPMVSLDYRGRRTRLTSGYEGTFLMYRTFDELNSSEQRLRAHLEHRATRRATLFAEGDLAQVPTTDALELAGIPFYRVGSRMQSGGGGVDVVLSRHTSLRGTYALRSVQFDNDILGRDLQGGLAHEGMAALERAVSSRLTIGAEYDIRRAFITGGLDQFNSHTASLTIGYDVTPTVTISGLAGVSRLDPGGTNEARLGPAVRAAITHRARLLILSALYQRSFIPSFGFGGTFQNEEWQGNVHVPFARARGYVTGSVARYNNEPLETDRPSLQSMWISTTLGYRATRWLSVESFYSRSHQTNERPGGNLGRQQIGFQVLATKPMKLH